MYICDMSIRDINNAVTTTLRELLYRHDCVIIPGFGGFICNYLPSATDEQSGRISPPSRAVSFNRNLKHNDGLLINAVAIARESGYDQARHDIELFVSDLIRRLSAGEKVKLTEIGAFRNNSEGNLQFEPDRSVNYNPDSYGLESFIPQKREGYDVRSRITESGPVRQMSGTRKIVIAAAVTIPLAIAIAAIPLSRSFFADGISEAGLSPFAGRGETTMATPSLNREEIRAAVIRELDAATISEATVAARDKTDLAAEHDQKEVPRDKSKEQLAAESNRYHIITGSFRAEENAMTHMEQLKKEGFDPLLLVTEEGLHRVAISNFANKPAALDTLGSLQRLYPGSWIFTAER